MSPRYIPEDLKQAVHERADGQCEYCRSQEAFATHDFSIEHIIPIHLGGKTTLDNLALACQGCNNFKFTRVVAMDPVSQEEVPLFHPRRDRWRDHFSWNDDSTRIIGRTPAGRATVELLRLNRSNLVNFRNVLFAAGKHPPQEIEDK